MTAEHEEVQPRAATVELAHFDDLWDYGDPAGTEASFEIALTRARTEGETLLALEIQTQIGRTHSLRGQFDSAHAVLDEVDAALALSSDEGRERVAIRSWLERGRSFNSSGRPDEARPLFLQAWERSRSSGWDGPAVDAAHMLGIVETGEASLAWNEKAIALAETSEDPAARKWLGALSNNIGWTYHDMGRFEDALARFEQGLAWRLEQQDVGPIRIARWSVARCLRSLGRIDEALEIQQELRDEWARSGGEDGYVFEELGELLLLKGDRDGAREAFAQAAGALAQDSWFVEHEAERLGRLRRLGAVPDPER